MERKKYKRSEYFFLVYMEVMLTNIENKISEMKIKESKKQVLFQQLDIETIERLSKTMTGK